MLLLVFFFSCVFGYQCCNWFDFSFFPFPFFNVFCVTVIYFLLWWNFFFVLLLLCFFFIGLVFAHVVMCCLCFYPNETLTTWVISCRHMGMCARVFLSVYINRSSHHLKINVEECLKQFKRGLNIWSLFSIIWILFI